MMLHNEIVYKAVNFEKMRRISRGESQEKQENMMEGTNNKNNLRGTSGNDSLRSYKHMKDLRL